MDNRDGTYVLRVQPKKLGRHTLTIKYDNKNVPGSPFTFNVTNPPDPSRVKVYGPGIEHGILHTFKSNFVVDTKGAGAGQLTVQVRGPKGAFNVEIQRDSAQERTIHCKYEPREPSDYQVEVKWHGHHVSECHLINEANFPNLLLWFHDCPIPTDHLAHNQSKNATVNEE